MRRTFDYSALVEALSRVIEINRLRRLNSEAVYVEKAFGRVLEEEDTHRKRGSQCQSSRFPEAETIVCQQFDEAFNEVSITPSTYLVTVTRSHMHDELALRRTIASEAAYIGMIGSRRKVEKIFKTLRDSGIPEKAVRRVYAPIGLDIGAETPEEIAVSIMAEIIRIRKGSTGKSLRLGRENPSRTKRE